MKTGVVIRKEDGKEGKRLGRWRIRRGKVGRRVARKEGVK